MPIKKHFEFDSIKAFQKVLIYGYQQIQLF